MNIQIIGKADGFTSQGALSVDLVKACARHGHLVAFTPWASDSGPCAIPKSLPTNWLGPIAEAYVQISPMDRVFGRVPQKQVILMTLCESTELRPVEVHNMNRYKSIITHSHWCAYVMRMNGVTVPINVLPLGYDEAFDCTPPARTNRKFVFASGGALGGSGNRKCIEDVLAAFHMAFPVTNDDVSLEIKLLPWNNSLDSLAEHDHHVKLIKELWSFEQLSEWYHNVDVFVSMSRGEGFGLMPLEAWACGAKVIAPIHSGHSEYMRHIGAWPLCYKTEPAACHDYQGDWYTPDVVQCANAMELMFNKMMTDAVLNQHSGRTEDRKPKDTMFRKEVRMDEIVKAITRYA